MAWITPFLYFSIYCGLVATTFYLSSYLDHRKKIRASFSEKELPFVSVIIPAFNEESSIIRTIESILKSEYPRDRFEVIVVDDGSTDATHVRARTFLNRGVRVFTKQNGGKGTALNFGIARAQGEIIFTMDADTSVDPSSVRKMVQPFTNPRVMGVTPAMLIEHPRTFLERIQFIEYYLGVFLRRAFSTLHAVYITPGAFSCYRKAFFEKHGGYDEHNITEDIEISLRIQSKGYFIDNCPDAPAYTIPPRTFRGLLIQRRRWYFGYMRNLVAYRTLVFNKHYGDLGMFIMPIGILSIFFSLLVMVYLFTHGLSTLYDELSLFILNDYTFRTLSFDQYFLERLFYQISTNFIFISLFFFIGLSLAYLLWATRHVPTRESVFFNLLLFFFFFAPLYGFWWVVSVGYFLFARTVRWR